MKLFKRILRKRILRKRILRSSLPLAMIVIMLFTGCGKNDIVADGLSNVREKIVANIAGKETVPKENEIVAGELYPAIYQKTTDGGTIEVAFNNKSEKVHMIGIDCSESVHSDENINAESLSENLFAMTKALLSDYEGKEIYLEFDASLRDDHGSLQAYVWLSKDVDNINKSDMENEMINAMLLQMGMVVPLAIKPNIKNEAMFKEFNDVAINTGVGIYCERQDRQ